jgi:hypothetical protein
VHAVLDLVLELRLDLVDLGGGGSRRDAKADVVGFRGQQTFFDGFGGAEGVDVDAVDYVVDNGLGCEGLVGREVWERGKMMAYGWSVGQVFCQEGNV